MWFNFLCRFLNFVLKKLKALIALSLLNNQQLRDFPGSPVVKNPPSSAGDGGSIPGQGTKTPHVTGRLQLLSSDTKASVLQLEKTTNNLVKTQI